MAKELDLTYKGTKLGKRNHYNELITTDSTNHQEHVYTPKMSQISPVEAGLHPQLEHQWRQQDVERHHEDRPSPKSVSGPIYLLSRQPLLGPSELPTLDRTYCMGPPARDSNQKQWLKE